MEGRHAAQRTITTLYVHGIGLWPGVFRATASRVGGQHLTWIRPGYERNPGSVRLDDQIRALAREITRWAPTRVVGVDAGATLALACAIIGVDGLVGIVTHEPVVGPLEPELDARMTEVGERLRRAPSWSAAENFLLGLHGRRSWSRLPDRAHAWAEHHHAVVCREVQQVASFAPTSDELAAVTVPHVTTVGATSGPGRHRVAARLAELGATACSLPGAGHLAVVDHPEALAATIVATSTGAGRDRTRSLTARPERP